MEFPFCCLKLNCRYHTPWTRLPTNDGRLARGSCALTVCFWSGSNRSQRGRSSQKSGPRTPRCKTYRPDTSTVGHQFARLCREVEDVEVVYLTSEHISFFDNTRCLPNFCKLACARSPTTGAGRRTCVKRSGYVIIVKGFRSHKDLA